MGIYGQDWASYQVSQPATDGLSFAFVKVTEGLGYTNPKWVAQRDHAKAHGLVWGAYHYPHMANDPVAEADFFLSKVAWKPGDIIVLDWEGYDTANRNVPRAQQAAYKDAWLRHVKQRMPHNPVGTYMNTDYWSNGAAGYVGDFLWIATANRPAGQPGIKGTWLFHQYSANTVDRDYCPLGSTAELRAWALAFANQTPPEEDIVTPQDIQAIANAVWDRQVPIPRRNPDGTIRYEPSTQAAYWPLVWGNIWAAEAQARDAVLQAAITSLAGLLAAQHTDLTPEQITAAVEAGLRKVVEVDIHVTQPAPSTDS